METIIEIPIIDELQQDCYLYNAVDAPSELKKHLLQEFSDIIDKIIINDKPENCDLNWLINKLNSIKIVDNGK